MPITIEEIASKLDVLLRQQSELCPRWLSVRRAAAYTSLSEVSVRRLISAGKIEAKRVVKGKVLIDRIQLDALISGSNSNPRRGRGLLVRG